MAERENGVWGEIQQQLQDVQNFLLNGQYKEAVILDKEILSLLVRMQIDQALMVSGNLEGDINQLFEGGVISAQARDAYHGIRAFGELAALGNETSAQDANDSFSMLRDALSNYVEEMQGGREKQLETSSPRVNPSSYGEEAPRINADGYSVKSANAYLREESDGELGIPIRRNSGRSGRPSSGTNRSSSGARDSVKRRVNRGTGQRKGRRPSSQTEWDLYSIIKIALAVLCIILVILIVRAFAFPKKKAVQTTAAVTTVAETAESTEAESSSTEETTEAAMAYFVTTGVRVRTKPSTDAEVLTVLDSGTEIKYKSDYNDQWVVIDYNGQDAYVSKQYVRSEEVQSVASQEATTATSAKTKESSTAKTKESSSAKKDGSKTITVSP
jgi:hypothetical protein